MSVKGLSRPKQEFFFFFLFSLFCSFFFLFGAVDSQRLVSAQGGASRSAVVCRGRRPHRFGPEVLQLFFFRLFVVSFLSPLFLAFCFGACFSSLLCCHTIGFPRCHFPSEAKQKKTRKKVFLPFFFFFFFFVFLVFLAFLLAFVLFALCFFAEQDLRAENFLLASLPLCVSFSHCFQKSHPDWWSAELNGKTGLIPAKYVQVGKRRYMLLLVVLF